MQTQKEAFKKRTNLSIQVNLLSEARELGLNISASAELGIAQAIANERKRRWLENNNAAISSSNIYVKENGLPLAKYRLF